jgi:hypothetical protein
MTPREVVDAYLEGRLNSWGVFRRLLALGLSTATALAVTNALPAAARTHDLGGLTAVAAAAEESAVVNDLVAHLAAQLERLEKGGPIRPVAATLAHLGANNRGLVTTLSMDVNDGHVNLNGELRPGQGEGDLNLVLNGVIGQTNVDLMGAIRLPDDGSHGFNANIGAVHLSFNGNVGNTPLNFDGDLNNLNVP